jgi:hypothetical protein
MNILDVSNEVYNFNIHLMNTKILKKIFFEDSFFIITCRNFFTMDIFSRNSVNISNYLSYKQIKQVNITQQFI